MYRPNARLRIIAAGLTIAVFAGAIQGAGAATVIEAKGTGNCGWDGKQDVSPCIQQAIAAAQGAGVVHIPAGTWPLGKAIIATDNITLQGDGDKTVLVPASGNTSEPVLLEIKLHAKNVTVKAITFDGGGAEFPNDKTVISGTSVTHILFDDVTVRNTHGVGLLLQGGTSDSGVQHSRFINLGNHWKVTKERKDRIQGLVFCCGTGNTGNFAIDDRFEDIGLDALQIGNQDGFVARNNTFNLSNDQFRQVKSGDYPAGIFAIDSRNVTISDNTIRNSPGNGIDAPGLQNSTISHNTILGSGSAGIGIFIGYDKKTQAHDDTIVGNTVTNSGQWSQASFLGGITVAGGTPANITISGNTVTDTQSAKTQKYGVFVTRGTSPANLKIDPDNHLAGNLAGTTFSDNK